MIKAKATNTRISEPGGLWHQPSLLALLADVLTVLGVIGLAWAAFLALQRMPVYPMREVVIAAQPQQVSAEQIAHVVRTTVIGNFFTVDLEAVRTAVEKLPWVRSAAVRRIWPDGVEITLEEHEAVAHWRQHNGESGLINRQGEVFLVDPPENAYTLPRFSGPAGAAGEILARHREFAQKLGAINRSIDMIGLSPRGAWRLRLDDGLVIDLGRLQGDQKPAELIGRLVAHYAHIKNQFGSVRVADLRYPNGFAISGFGRAANTEVTGRNS
jgi:cell division protein FtsQ